MSIATSPVNMGLLMIYNQKKPSQSEKAFVIYKLNNFFTVADPARTSSDLKKKVAEIKCKIDSGRYRKDSNVTIEDYSSQWYRTYKINKSVNTNAMYKYVINSHIIPAIGHIQIKDLKKSDIQKMINERVDKTRLCEQIILTLKQIIYMAIEDEIILKNPCTKIELPKRISKGSRALTKLEIEAIKTAPFTDKEKVFVSILYYFGLRRQEAIALMKQDFDFKNSKLKVSRAIAFDVNQGDLKETKTKDGERTLDIPEGAKEILKKYIDSLPSLYLFTKADGNVMSKSAYNNLFNGIRNKINSEMGGTSSIRVTDLTAYTFRHNFCTLLY